MKLLRQFSRLVAAFVPLSIALAQPAVSPLKLTPPVRAGDDGKLIYTPDDAGNRVIDFSAAGYAGGGVAIPNVPAKIVVAPQGPDDGRRIQAAIDLVGKMPAGPDGFRGAVLLKPGRFQVSGSLRLTVSGVVLRGSGRGEGGTVINATGQSRRTVIEIEGAGERTEVAGSRQTIADEFMPVGATKFSVGDASGFSIGARVVIRRPSTKEWIAKIGMGSFSGWTPGTRITWVPGSRDLAWERTITAIEGKTLTVDAPITTALEKAFGGGTVAKCEFAGRIDHVGVENLRCVSEFDRAAPMDEEHAWGCVRLDKVENAWVRQVTAQHFVGYAFNAQAESKSVTIEDCEALDPVSELANYRRRVFSIGGQLVLVQRCRSEHGLRDFTTGFAATGPNVFLQCSARGALDSSGPMESWESGVLYDNVVIRGNALRFVNRGANGQGAGWTAANSIIWNCESTELQVQSAPGAQNFAFGCKGLIVDDNLAFDPRTMPFRDFVKGGAGKPDSLYLAQLTERLGAGAAARMAAAAISLSADGTRALAASDVPPIPAPKPVHPLRVENSQFTLDGQRAFQAVTNWSWYLGQMPRNLARPSGVAITRFTPGETGVGQTDRLEDVVASLAPGAAFVHHYGLWYDRRRINHNFYGAPELPASDVSAPFMEQPWARSGQGTDWDGMSKYDLTKFNPWFFSRVKEFADLCDANGRILVHSFYFQHPVQETRAHYVDFPWRPVNCLQDTGLPDENPAGATFYDLSSPVRRDLHRLYIRHCLDVLKDNVNVVYTIDREYSGPLSFVQFWLDTIADWEKENRKKVFVALEVPKAEMDAILADPVRRPMITAIEFFNWNYRADGSLFKIEGGLNKAPREQIQAQPQGQGGRGGGAGGGAELRYRAYREYRDAFPDLVLLRKNDDFPTVSAAVEKAIPAAARAPLRSAPLVRTNAATSWATATPGKAYLVYTMTGAPVDLDLSKESGDFSVSWIDAATGQLNSAADSIAAGKVVTLTPSLADIKHPWVAWLTRR